jgi:hypothetical protein
VFSKARKRAQAEESEDLKYFLMFLLAYTVDDRRALINRLLGGVVTPPPPIPGDVLPNEQERWDIFNAVVSDGRFPQDSGKREITYHRRFLHQLLDACEYTHDYQDLDRFLQFLRAVDKSGALENFLSSLTEGNRDAVRLILQQLRAGGIIGMRRASDLPPGFQNEVRSFMNSIYAYKPTHFARCPIHFLTKRLMTVTA